MVLGQLKKLKCSFGVQGGIRQKDIEKVLLSMFSLQFSHNSFSKISKLPLADVSIELCEAYEP